jgi:Type I phosphodiesterase / nucleotide pyrophosphatase
MRRRDFLAAAASALACPPALAARRKTSHVVLFTSDGVRWQDLFTGIDPLLMNEKAAGMGTEAAELRSRLWKPSPEERRAALMPFFWNTLAPRGVVLGNLNKGSSMQVSNRYRVSYPGYSEILTGRPQDQAIKGNDPIRNPTPSFLQFLKDRSHLRPEQVAVFASWKLFHDIAESRPGDIFINAGYEACARPRNSAKVALLNQLQSEARFLDSSSRHDAFTFELAMEYLNAESPEHLFLSFDETDDWAHNKRYDQVLESLQYFDRSLQKVWGFLQNSSKYRETTTLVVTCDHGRGRTLQDWPDHGPKVPGDEQIWAAFIGPDTPARGEISDKPVRYQRDIAPTILGLLSVEPGAYPGVEGSPIPEAFA